MDKRFWGFLAAVAAILGLIFFISTRNASAPSQTGTLTSHLQKGSASAVTLTEYGDFQCPACGDFYPIVKQAVAPYKEQVTFQFRNFPLYQIHQNAIAGARAAEAADLQGKYWEMHDKLFNENNLYYQAQRQGKVYNTWISSSSPIDEFTGYASGLGLDVNKFKTDFKSKYVNDRIQADIKAGNGLKIQSTPTFFIDNKKISNPNSLEDFKKVLANAIEQKTGKKPAETASDLPASTESSAQ